MKRYNLSTLLRKFPQHISLKNTILSEGYNDPANPSAGQVDPATLTASEYAKLINSNGPENPFRLADDEEHWKSYGIKTGSELEDYFVRDEEREHRKEEMYGGDDTWEPTEPWQVTEPPPPDPDAIGIPEPLDASPLRPEEEIGDLPTQEPIRKPEPITGLVRGSKPKRPRLEAAIREAAANAFRTQ